MSTATRIDHHVTTVGADDVAVLTTSSAKQRVRPNDDVMAAVRYLLYRHELTTGSQELPQMIAVVGGALGDGVTTVSRSLAEVLAEERNSRVCWVDFDSDRLVPPAGARRAELGVLDDTPTLMAAPSDVIPAPYPSPIPPTQLSDGIAVRAGALARAELDAFVDNLARGYRHVVFDTPPLLDRPDSIGLLRRADAYILVVRHGESSLNDIRRVSEELRSIPSLGAVLNAQRIRTPRFLRRLVAG